MKDTIELRDPNLPDGDIIVLRRNSNRATDDRNYHDVFYLQGNSYEVIEHRKKPLEVGDEVIHTSMGDNLRIIYIDGKYAWVKFSSYKIDDEKYGFVAKLENLSRM